MASPSRGGSAGGLSEEADDAASVSLTLTLTFVNPFTFSHADGDDCAISPTHPHSFSSSLTHLYSLT